MPVRASVVSLPEPGHAVLRVSELDAAPDGLTLSIQRQQGPDSHLADDGWRRTEAWLLPERVERRRDVLEFHLGPEICDRLEAITDVGVPNVALTLTNSQTGEQYTVRSDADGRFAFDGLPDGDYRGQANAMGFTEAHPFFKIVGGKSLAPKVRMTAFG